MRCAVAAACLIGVLGIGCEDNPDPTLTISPSNPGGAVEITAPTQFTATIARSTDEVTVVWSLEGGGTLSNTSGYHVTYSPPPGTGTATLIATAGDLTAQVVVTSGPATLTSAVIPGLSAPVTVQYDAEDIPHIQCATANDCFAVQGYIQARDRLFPMDFLRHVARSRLAELIGPDGLTQDVQLRTIFITRAGHRLEDDLTRALDPQTRAVLTAFVGGINAYLAQLRASGGQLPGEYDQLPFALTPADIADWTLEDSVAMVRLFQYQLSESLTAESENGKFAAVYGQGALADPGKINAWIRAAAPPSERAHTLAPTPFSAAAAATAPSSGPAVDLSPWRAALDDVATRAGTLRDLLRRYGPSIGSNNWVVTAGASATGAAMVANDPHLTLQYPPQFHLAALTSTNAGDNLNLAGGSFPGLPGAQVGRGAHVGWGVTVVGYDVTDLYLEQFLPQTACPSRAPCVQFQGAPVSTLPVPQTYLVRVGPGTAVVDASTLNLPTPPPAAVLVVPQHGPIIQAPDATGRGISVRWTGQEGNTQDLKAFIGLNTATDVDAAMVALRDYATGAQNFVLADDQGHIAYDPHALIPVRPFADPRVRGANVIPPWFPLPGDGSAEWGTSSACAAATETPVPASCWISDAELPQGKDPAKGYFFTANADPTFPSVSDDNNPLAHPPYLSFDWGDSTGFRATRIDQLLAGAIADHGKVTLADMEAIQSDHVSRPGMVFGGIIDAIATDDASSPTELVLAKNVFTRWAANGYDCPSGLLGTDPVNSAADPNPAVIEASSGCYLFHAFLRRLITNVFTDDLRVAGQAVRDEQAVTAILYMLSLPAGSPGARLCNDVDARGQVIATHTCMDQVVAALVSSIDALVANVGATPSDWTWGRTHTLTLKPLIQLVTIGFSPGPFARPGGAFTVDVGNPLLHGNGLEFPYTSGAQVRHISVMAATPVVKMQLPGPERDVPADIVGPNLLGMYLVNQYFDFAFGDQIANAVVSTQTFTEQ